MKPAVLCLLLLSACSDLPVYKLTWTCLSPEGCERADAVALVDRVTIFPDGFLGFWSSRDDDFREDAQVVPSDTLPPECSLLYGLVLFTHELEPFKYCRTSGGFELEPSILNQDSATHSEWLVEGREIDS